MQSALLNRKDHHNSRNDEHIRFADPSFLPSNFYQSQRDSCCPAFFERASHTWWDPKFDSEILENQYWKRKFPQLQKRFKSVLLYLLVTTIAVGIYHGVYGSEHWFIYLLGCSCMIIVLVLILIFVHTRFYINYHIPVSLVLSLILIILSLSSFSVYDLTDNSSLLSLFSLLIEILLLIYAVIPLPLYICMILGFLYSLGFEILSGVLTADKQGYVILLRVLIQLMIHFIGLHIHIMKEVRTRSTFMKIGQLLLTRRELHAEKIHKEERINNIMPPKVVRWLITNRNWDDLDEDSEEQDDDVENYTNIFKMTSPFTFRDLKIQPKDNVSIMFADIVGFTKLSSSQTAEQLVTLLNILFGRFDDLCLKNGCEKISILGDCYYCVAGCLDKSCTDHAQRCVEMGLDLVKAIREFDAEVKVEINMRVGIHTGKVLFGIVGKKRVKFDVFSNDVTFANLMESSGKPGMVHISQETYQQLKDYYNVEEGEIIKGKI